VVDSGSIDVGAGAVLRTDVGGALTLSAVAGALTVSGTLEAPAGRIELNGKSIALASGAQLLARGVPVIRPDARGWRTGEVLPGGDIVLSNGVTGAALALDPGARIDVSGASGEFDEPTYRRFGGA
jgi:filamentous hemagglutinin